MVKPELSQRARELLQYIEERHGNFPMGDHPATIEDAVFFGLEPEVTPQFEAKGLSRMNVAALDELITAGLVRSHVVDIWDDDKPQIITLVHVLLRTNQPA